MSIFGRREIERLKFQLALAKAENDEQTKEIRYLTGVQNAQAATIEALSKELRASDELIHQLQATERKLFQMYNASETARQELARKLRGEETADNG